jgi:hypothetical protein
LHLRNLKNNSGSNYPKIFRHCGGTLTLSSNDVSGDRKILEEAGSKILGELDESWGHMLIFEDLDGNVLKLQNAKY